MSAVPTASQIPVVGDQRQSDAEEREHQADQRRQVLEEDYREFGGLGPADELPPTTDFPARGSTRGSPCGTSSLQPDGHHQDDERDPPPAALDRLRVLELVERLVEGEQTTDGEQHDRDHERPEVALPAVPEGVQRRGLLARATPTKQQQRLVARVGDRVDRLRQHRAGPGQQVRDELRDRDAEVRGQRRDDRPGSALSRHPSSVVGGVLPAEDATTSSVRSPVDDSDVDGLPSPAHSSGGRAAARPGAGHARRHAYRRTHT